MAMQEEVNFSHKDANWRSLCDKEIKTTQAFESNWGFLCDKEGAKGKLEARRQRGLDTRPPPPGAESKRAQSSTLVKYRDAKGGGWTVKRKMVPELQKGVADLDIATKPDPMSARGRAEFTHTMKMQTMAEVPIHVTTNMDYGSRITLEQFGISGVSAVPKQAPISIDEIEAQVRKQRREEMGTI